MTKHYEYRTDSLVTVACVDCGDLFDKWSRSGRQIRCVPCQLKRERALKRINERKRCGYGERRKTYTTGEKCYTVIRDPDEYGALCRGAKLTKTECACMLEMGNFTPGTVLKSINGGPVMVVGDKPQKLRPVRITMSEISI